MSTDIEKQNWLLLDGVRTRRIFAFVIDYAMILILIAVAVPLIAVLGVATLGAAWLLYPILGMLVAGIYIAWTVGGEKQATWGMQMMSIKLSRYDGQRIDSMTAIVHAVLFWATTAIFMPLLLAPLLLEDKRTLHDLALGTRVIRSDR
ncbi:RDD family protein [Ahrensia marina]|uniref:Membrane protein n=1 Tax=Ahrensia marina TaxID=1514904 RepID=A0A0N0E7Y9_9HYPH|nr:RDD family protein [Ahrensia marina]KPB01748.1 membrane protein [Ahrensia marina]